LGQVDTPSLAVTELATYFRRNGCIRRQNSDRVATDGWATYKKGDEIRLTANSKAELARIRMMLVIAGFKPGAPYIHGATQHRQPVYGREQVRRFLEMVKAVPQDAQRARQPDKTQHARQP